MDESALERFFDKYIANDSSRVDEEDEDDDGEKAFFRLLPDELLDYSEENRSAKVSSDGSSSLDHNPQNPLAICLDHNPQNNSVSFPPQLEPVVRNVVSKVNLGCRLDLKLIARNTWNIEHKPKVFSVVTMRIRRPRTTANIFNSGVLICIGATSVEESKVAARRFARIVQKLGFPVRFLNFKIQLMMATCSSFPVSLEELALAHSEHCSYEPELFSCAHYWVQPGHCMTISALGTLTLTGPKTLTDLHRSFEIIYPILCNFRATNLTRKLVKKRN